MSANKAIQTPLAFGQLVGTIRHVHEELTAQASRAVNVGLKLRNWIEMNHNHLLPLPSMRAKHQGNSHDHP